MLVAIAPAGARKPAVSSAADSAEASTAAYFDRILASPPRLRAFLQAMPKGGDLHTHLGGAVYAEDYLRWAADDGRCLERETARVVEAPCTAAGRVPVADAALRDLPLYGRAIDAMSVRGYENGIGDPTVPVHQRFFSAFDRFRDIANDHTGDTLAAVRTTAAGDRVAYLEIMYVPPAVRAFRDASVANGAGWGADGHRLGEHDFDARYAALMPLVAPTIAQARHELDDEEARALKRLDCASATPQPGCAVEVRYQVPASRIKSPDRVFASLMFAFAFAKADPRYVGVNLLGEEHHPVALRDYALHMRMLAFFRQRYPSVKLSLHAGELSLGLVPPGDLRSHIAQAVDTAGTDRIGHGVDIAYEDDAAALLQRMARKRVAVEVNLSSNAAILGVSGAAHPLAMYRAAGVPVLLSTDDQGVLRSDMTNEYQRAAQEQGLRYLDLKRIARDSLQYAFVPGASLWRDESGGARIAACVDDDVGAEPGEDCAKFLSANDKARLQWRLERQLASFEREPRRGL